MPNTTVRCPAPVDSTGRSPGHAAPVSCNRWLGSGLGRGEVAAHALAQEVGDEGTPNRKPDEGAEIPPNERIRRIAHQVHREEPEGKPVPPPSAIPKPDSGEGTGGCDGRHEEHGPGTHTEKGGVRLRIEAPHGFEHGTWPVERDARGTGDDGAKREEASHGDQAYGSMMHL